MLEQPINQFLIQPCKKAISYDEKIMWYPNWTIFKDIGSRTKMESADLKPNFLKYNFGSNFFSKSLICDFDT